MDELEDEDETPPPSPRNPRHRTRRPIGSILKERRDSRPNLDLPVHNPGISGQCGVTNHGVWSVLITLVDSATGEDSVAIPFNTGKRTSSFFRRS